MPCIDMHSFIHTMRYSIMRSKKANYLQASKRESFVQYHDTMKTCGHEVLRRNGSVLPSPAGMFPSIKCRLCIWYDTACRAMLGTICWVQRRITLTTYSTSCAFALVDQPTSPIRVGKQSWPVKFFCQTPASANAVNALIE